MEVVVASGKGGTGKTFIASNLTYFIWREEGVAVGVDADAEAPDLLVALGGSRRRINAREVRESRKARIDPGKCTGCLRCFEVCRFNAVDVRGGVPSIIEEYCEGCGACAIACPAGCIDFYVARTGYINVDESAAGPIIVTADLEVGGRNTGDLVYLAKEEGRRLAWELGARHVVVDAAAGIGCPVISSLAGADLLIVVVEPTPPSLKGAKRLLDVAEQFRLRAYLILNKYDLAPDYAEKVAEELGIEVLGRVRYDRVVAEAYASMEPLLARDPQHEVSKTLTSIFKHLLECVLH
ncbi:MAG: 4Fe-4S dicluster domain-containing protein [Crenarchaeota archaeon]|nr:4Fe-4S dicluster domain-containing protein [Thermoproteota archaeon]